MNLKSIFLTLIVSCTSVIVTKAQTTCNLINSITLNVPDSQSSIRSHGHVAYLNDSANPYHLTLDLQEWQYIAITKDSNNIARIYKNGQLTFQGYFDDLTYAWSKLILGAVQFGNYRSWFNGFIDEVRVSNIVRPETELINNYSSNNPFTADANTVGLWHFDQISGTNILATVGTNGSTSNAIWDAGGKFGQCLFYNGVDALAEIHQQLPSAKITFEFWIKPSTVQVSWPVAWYGIYTSGLVTSVDSSMINYTWSTGETGTTVTIDPSTAPIVWVSDGACTDSIWFNSQFVNVFDTTHINVFDTTLINVFDTTHINVFDTTHINVFDTTHVNVFDTTYINVFDTTHINVFDTTHINVFDTTHINVFDTTHINVFDTTHINVFDTTYINIFDTTHVNVYDTTFVSVEDTLRINLTILGTNPPNPTTIILYPNPASTHLIIDFGDYSLLSGYSLRIINVLGQVILRSPINQQRSYFDLSTWTGRGIYFVQIIDPGNATVATKKLLIL